MKKRKPIVWVQNQAGFQVKARLDTKKRQPQPTNWRQQAGFLDVPPVYKEKA